MDIGQIWNEGVVGSLTLALEWLNAGLLAAGLDTPWLSSWALTIILFTVIIKLVTLPLTLTQIRSQKAMQALQPQLQALQKQYAKDREKLTQEQMRLYREHNVNPAAGCLPLVVQMPIWIGLYSALFSLGTKLEGSRFLWISNLAVPEPNSLGPLFGAAAPETIAIPVLALLTGVTGWLTQKMMTQPTTDSQQQMMQSMMGFMPLMFVVFAFSVPAGLVLYWVVTNLFTIVQSYLTTGWGSLRPAARVAAAAPAVAVAKPAAKQVAKPEAKLPPGSRAGLSASPESNGHSDEAGAVQRAIPQAPPAARKRRRRNR